MWKEIHDIDVATNVPMEDIEKRFVCHDIGKNKDFWVLVVKRNDEIIEVAQFRNDWEYSDGRRPDEVRFVKTIKEDLARRDLTINAMAMDKDWKIIDPYGGWKDIHDKIIRFVGDYEERLREDWLRVLRAMRFAARFWFTFEDDLSWINLKEVSNERVWQEFRKAASYWWKAFAQFLNHLYHEWYEELSYNYIYSHMETLWSADYIVLFTSMLYWRWEDHRKQMYQKLVLSKEEIKKIERILEHSWIYDDLHNRELNIILHITNHEYYELLEDFKWYCQEKAISKVFNIDYEPFKLALKVFNWDYLQEQLAIREKIHINSIKDRLEQYIANHRGKKTVREILSFIDARYETVYLSSL